jgi:hypothetical protein
MKYSFTRLLTTSKVNSLHHGLISRKAGNIFENEVIFADPGGRAV